MVKKMQNKKKTRDGKRLKILKTKFGDPKQLVTR